MNLEAVAEWMKQHNKGVSEAMRTFDLKLKDAQSAYSIAVKG